MRPAAVSAGVAPVSLFICFFLRYPYERAAWQFRRKDFYRFRRSKTTTSRFFVCLQRSDKQSIHYSTIVPHRSPPGFMRRAFLETACEHGEELPLDRVRSKNEGCPYTPEVSFRCGRPMAWIRMRSNSGWPDVIDPEGCAHAAPSHDDLKQRTSDTIIKRWASGDALPAPREQWEDP